LTYQARHENDFDVSADPERASLVPWFAKLPRPMSNANIQTPIARTQRRFTSAESRGSSGSASGISAIGVKM
jgi:hypothetical protein